MEAEPIYSLLSLSELLNEANGRCRAANEMAAHHLKNEQYYRGLVVQIGKMFGDDAYISDDGSKQEDVLCAKVPELVEETLQKNKRQAWTIAELNNAIFEWRELFQKQVGCFQEELTLYRSRATNAEETIMKLNVVLAQYNLK